MTNLTERLRYCGKELADYYSHAAIFDEAADEIERLRALPMTEAINGVRLRALEEAAGAAEYLGRHAVADAIRALKEKADDLPQS